MTKSRRLFNKKSRSLGLSNRGHPKLLCSFIAAVFYPFFFLSSVGGGSRTYSGSCCRCVRIFIMKQNASQCNNLWFAKGRNNICSQKIHKHHVYNHFIHNQRSLSVVGFVVNRTYNDRKLQNMLAFLA